MIRLLSLSAVSVALVALGLGIRARFLVHQSHRRTTRSDNVGILLPIGIIVGALPAALALESLVLSVLASLISFAFIAAAIFLLRRSQRS
jgi:hypothetical protein